jgi:opacity protein-like surface antigen
LKRSLILVTVTVLALGSLAQAKGFGSHVSLGAGIEGIFPGSTFTRTQAENSNGLDSATQSTTNSVGVVGSFRFDFGGHSAFDFSVTGNRSSEVSELVSGGSALAPGRVQTNNLEFIGSYVFRLPSTKRFKPYFLVGGGMVNFRPLENGYVILGNDVPQSQSKAAFAYGFGADFYFNDHWGMRLQFRSPPYR